MEMVIIMIMLLLLTSHKISWLVNVAPRFGGAQNWILIVSQAVGKSDDVYSI